MKCPYRFVLELRRENGELLSSEAFSPDWEPALECTRLAGLRTRNAWASPSDPEPRVEPVWHATAGEPLVQGFSVHMAQGEAAWSEAFDSTRYFVDLARSVVARCLEEGRVSPGERTRFVISAYRADPLERTAPPEFDAVERPQPLKIHHRSFAALAREAGVSGELDESDLQVVIPGHLLEEVSALARDAGAREVGGLLVGHLCRDEPPRGVGIEVTAQIPARHTVGDAVKLTFTSETWTDVRATIALRGAGELLLGYWHSHPARSWCAECPVERQQVCRLATGFLSPQDRALHRAMFPSAFSLALVVTDSISGIDTRLFGWRRGVLEPRGFRVGAPRAATATRGASDATTDATTSAPVVR